MDGAPMGITAKRIQCERRSMRKSFRGRMSWESKMTSSFAATVLPRDKELLLGWSRDSNHVTTQGENQVDICWSRLGGGASVRFLSGAEDDFVIGVFIAPHGMNETYPLVGQRAQRHTMALSFPSLALVIL